MSVFDAVRQVVMLRKLHASLHVVKQIRVLFGQFHSPSCFET